MSNYVLDQYNKSQEDTSENEYFMEIPKDETDVAIATVIDTQVNIGVNNLGSSITMKDEALQMQFDANTHYYFHGRIRKMPWVQQFDVKLYNSTESAEVKTQYIKTITVEVGSTETVEALEENWVDIEFIFTPQFGFTHLVFQMYRESQDFLNTGISNNQINFVFQNGRPTVIAYQEVSKIKNIIPSLLVKEDNADKSNLIKIGVQSRPGLLMCINGEEIRISRIGIYELKNGIMTTNFFSVCGRCPDTEKSDATENEWKSIDEWTAYINEQIKNENYQRGDKEHGGIHSYSFVAKGYKGNRIIPKFTIDYLYRNITS